MAAPNPNRTFQDFVSTLTGGQNSGVSPLILQENQFAFGLNLSLRGGYAHARAPIMMKPLNYQGDSVLQGIVENGLFQGAGYYRPDFGTELLLAQIAGHLIEFVENGSQWIVTDVSVPGDLNDPAGSQVWMWQSEKWMIVNDGSGRLPIFFDGTVSRRSLGDSVQVGNVIVDFEPPPVGGTVTLTLDAPYTGLYNTPIIINGSFYQALPVGSGAQSYPAILTNVSDTFGNPHVAGTSVIVNPAIFALSLVAQSFPANTFTVPQTFDVAISNPFTGPIGVVVTWFLPGQPWVIEAINKGTNSFFPNAYVLTLRYQGINIGVDFTIPAGTQILNAAPTAPSTVIGKLVDGFSAPAVGASVTVNLTSPYTSKKNQTVTINNKIYQISAVPPSPPTSQLTVINLTDETNNPEPQYPNTVFEPQVILSVPELPAGRMGAYGMGRNWFSLVDGISYEAGDIVGGPAGTPANSYRDSVLKTTENTFLAGGGTFRLPGAGDQITAMVFPPILDRSLGQGELQIFTSVSCFSNNSPVDRTVWELITSPIQTESLKDNGALAQNSTVLINSDTFFRSYVGFGSLVLARRDFGGWGNKSISNEMQRPLLADNQSLLPFGSAESFDNRFLSTCAPNTLGAGTFHVGLVSLNFDLISSLRTNLPPAWEGTWTGINALQGIAGWVNGSNRSFAFTYNIDTNKIELYEQLSETAANQAQVFKDNGVTPILWLFETAAMFNQNIKSITDLCQLIDGEMYLSNITDMVNVKVYYRPDFYPCWTLWHEFNVCADDDNSEGDGNKQAGYRMRIGLGSPSSAFCEPGNNRPLNTGYFFQFRIEFTGYCVFRGLRVKASEEKIPAPYAPVECETKPCQLIDCLVPDDLQIYSLQGFLPKPLPQDVTAKPKFRNQQVVFNNVCGSGTLGFTGTLPSWIQMDVAGNRFIGNAGVFGGQTQAAANATAQASLNQFVTFHLANGSITCTGTPPTTPIPDLAWYKFTEGSGTTSVDYSVAGRNLRDLFGGEVAWATGPTGNGAIQFLGASSANAPATTWATTDFSYSVWVKVGTPASSHFFDIMAALVTSPFFGPGSNLTIDSSNNLQFQAQAHTDSAGFGNVSAGTWHMVTMTYVNSTGAISFYVDGVLAGSTTIAVTLHDGEFIVGGTAPLGNQFNFLGFMSDLRVWSLALTPANVSDIFTTGAQ